MYKIQLIYKLLILIILFSFSFCDNATIKGSIKDISNKQILIGANIILLNTDYGSASNETGEYIINNKNIIDESLGINLIKYEDIEYMNDDVSGFKKWI